MQIVIDINENEYLGIKEYPNNITSYPVTIHLYDAVRNGTLLTPKVLADLLMEERIRGELKQDVSYSKDVIDDVRCRLTVDIIDRRPCYCGAELEAVWREKRKAQNDE